MWYCQIRFVWDWSLKYCYRWTSTDSIYGSRALAKDWENKVNSVASGLAQNKIIFLVRLFSTKELGEIFWTGQHAFVPALDLDWFYLEHQSLPLAFWQWYVCTKVITNRRHSFLQNWYICPPRPDWCWRHVFHEAGILNWWGKIKILMNKLSKTLRTGDWYDRLVAIERNLRRSTRSVSGKTIFKVSRINSWSIIQKCIWEPKLGLSSSFCHQHSSSGCCKDPLWHWGWPHSFQEERGANPSSHLCSFPQGKLITDLVSRKTHDDTGLAQDGGQCVLFGLQADRGPQQDIAGVCGRVPAFATVGQLISCFFTFQGKWQEEEKRG